MKITMANLQFDRSPDRSKTAHWQAIDIDRLLVDTDVLGTLETLAPNPGVPFVLRPGGEGGDPDEAIFAHKKPLATKWTQEWVRRFGMKIGQRQYLAAKYPLGDDSTFWVVFVHMPPKRMWGPFYDHAAYRLRVFLKTLPGPKIVVGDWNKRKGDDPARLRKTFGGRWYGSRIDNAWVHPQLVPRVKGFREIPQPNRNDNHPSLHIEIK